jgi:hypothetical protein
MNRLRTISYMGQRVYEAECICGLKWRVYRDEDDDGHSSTCVECGAVVYRLVDIEMVAMGPNTPV